MYHTVGMFLLIYNVCVGQFRIAHPAHIACTIHDQPPVSPWTRDTLVWTHIRAHAQHARARQHYNRIRTCAHRVRGSLKCILYICIFTLILANTHSAKQQHIVRSVCMPCQNLQSHAYNLHLCAHQGIKAQIHTHTHILQTKTYVSCWVVVQLQRIWVMSPPSGV